MKEHRDALREFQRVLTLICSAARDLEEADAGSSAAVDEPATKALLRELEVAADQIRLTYYDGDDPVLLEIVGTSCERARDLVKASATATIDSATIAALRGNLDDSRKRFIAEAGRFVSPPRARS